MPLPVWVIGLGIETPPVLSPKAEAIIQTASVLIGGKRQLALYPNHSAEKLTIGANIPEIIATIRERADTQIVVLASGDPGFHGIGSTLHKHLPDEDIRILPNLNSLQTAFARVGLPWNDAVFTSAHAHPLTEIIGWARRSSKLGILTDHHNTPAVIAQTLLAAGIPDCRAVVAEDLGTPQETITDKRLSDLQGKAFSPLNVLLLIQDPAWQPKETFINREDNDYAHRRGLITKQDIRALSIARLHIRPTSTLWDIGAGSGAVSIEMAALAWQGQVYAIEKDAENLAYIQENTQKYGALNVKVVAGHAPDALLPLPAPDGVFIGGSGGKLPDILQIIHQHARSGCRVVCNFATFENLHIGMEVMKQLGWQPTFSQINISVSKSIANLTRLEPLTPIFILKGTRP